MNANERQIQILNNIARAMDLREAPPVRAVRTEAVTLRRHNVHADRATISALAKIVSVRS